MRSTRQQEPRPRPLRDLAPHRSGRADEQPHHQPDALAKALQTRGQSLVVGARHFAHDLRHNGGMPSQVDTRPFAVGGNLAVTPGTSCTAPTCTS